MKKKNYVSPQSEVVYLRFDYSLLAGSTGGQNDGYNDVIDEDDPDGWH